MLVLAHSRTRARSMPAFLLADRAVVRSLRRHKGHTWARGFLDGLRTLDPGTISLWRSTADALRFAYRSGVHKDAVKAQRDGEWFTEAWFGRFGVRAAGGSWPGVELSGLLTSDLVKSRLEDLVASFEPTLPVLRSRLTISLQRAAKVKSGQTFLVPWPQQKKLTELLTGTRTTRRGVAGTRAATGGINSRAIDEQKRSLERQHPWPGRPA